MKEAQMNYSTTELCEAFNISMSGYYYKPAGISRLDQQMMISIQSVSKAVGHTYGKRRMALDLKALGYSIGVRKTKRLMNLCNIHVIVPRKRHYYPDNGLEHRFAPNILNREFRPLKINTHWVGDITYLHTHQGWSYLACVMDLHSKEVVGHAVSKSPNAALAQQALMNAIKRKRPNTRKLLFHSDQGTQYSAKQFRDCLKMHGITQSMSRRGNCWDNAVMERFFRSLKTERLNTLSFISHTAVTCEVQNYIYFYNYKRRHSAIGYLTPHQKALGFKKVA
jgi:putative transposase